MNRLRLLILFVTLFGSIGIAAANLLLLHLGGAGGGPTGCAAATLSLNLCLSTGMMGAAL
jgi:hypothetical protein